MYPTTLMYFFPELNFLLALVCQLTPEVFSSFLAFVKTLHKQLIILYIQFSVHSSPNFVVNITPCNFGIEYRTSSFAFFFFFLEGYPVFFNYMCSQISLCLLISSSLFTFENAHLFSPNRKLYFNCVMFGRIEYPGTTVPVPQNSLSVGITC